MLQHAWHTQYGISNTKSMVVAQCYFETDKTSLHIRHPDRLEQGLDDRKLIIDRHKYKPASI